jgi:hypothetical protein
LGKEEIGKPRLVLCKKGNNILDTPIHAVKVAA